MTRKRHLGEATAWMFLATMVLNACMVLYHGVTSRKLGDAYAQLAALNAIGNILAVLSGGVGAWLVKVFATDDAHGGDPQVKARMRHLAPRYLGAVALAGLLLLPLSSAVSTYLHTPQLLYLWTVAGFMTGMSVALLRSAIQGMHRFRWLGSSLAADGLGKVFSAWGLVAQGMGAAGAVAAQLIGNAFGAVLVWAGYTRGGTASAEPPELKVRVSDILYDTAALGLFSVLCYIDVAVVKHHLAETDAAHYSRAALVAKSFLYLAAALNMVLLPAVAGARASGRDPRGILLRLLGGALAVDLLGLAFVWAFTGWVISLLCGPDPAYQLMAPLVRSLSVAVIPLGLFQMLLFYHLALGSKLALWLLGVGAPLLWVLLEQSGGAGVQVPLYLGSVSLVLLIAALIGALRRA